MIPERKNLKKCLSSKTKTTRTKQEAERVPDHTQMRQTLLSKLANTTLMVCGKTGAHSMSKFNWSFLKTTKAEYTQE
ncbi:MAG TPA: hypothetical protein DD706_13560 [Nitrospiraceae bacterium]|nr:hypothetical protein [Nitrospiraceae bacterium]